MVWLLYGIGGEVMAVPEGKTRFTVTFGDEVLALVDAECKRTGLTRSAVLSNAVLDALDDDGKSFVTPEQMISLMQQVIRQRDGQ